MYRAVPYVGMAWVFDFPHATHAVVTDRGIELTLEVRSATGPDTRVERGRAA
ncbi:hypothetical protein [Streptomyces sp. NBC_00728]|uniref:hypothetical protein n=1 Tax=Streptomyces sp. NBC_00728 TaxID=2903676 RepID=UPI00386B730E